MSDANGRSARDRSSDRRSNMSGDTHRTRRSHRSRSRDRGHEKEKSRHDSRRGSRERSYRDRGHDSERSRHDRSKDDADRERERHRDRDRERERAREFEPSRHRERDERDRRERDRDRDRDRRRPRRDDYDDVMERDRYKRRREEPDRSRRDRTPDQRRDSHMDLDLPPPPSARRPHDSRSPSRQETSAPPPPRMEARERSPGLDDPLDKPIHRRGSPQARRGSPSYEAPSALVNDEPEPPEDDSEARSVFVSQLAARLTARDLGYFFEEHLGDGAVRDVRVVTDRISRRSKGIAYVEFRSMDLVPKAIGLSGTVVMGLPIMIQLTEAERNRTHASDLAAAGGGSNHRGGAMQLYVGSLHFNLTEADIRQVFEPFGELDFVDLHRDPLTGRSKGYAFVQYKRPEDAKMALEQMEGFELAGRALKLRVNTVHEKGSSIKLPQDSLEENGGTNLNAASRQALMQKLARTDSAPLEVLEQIRPNIPTAMATKCVLLKNMFDPEEETENDWDKELAEDVKRECQDKYGLVNGLKVEPESKGEIYIKFDKVDSAIKAIAGLNARFFGGRQITAIHISDAIMQAHL